METGIHNTSEIGRLRKVLLHRPGAELENLMPEYLERLLFDDIPYLQEAQREHDAFAECLRGQGVEVGGSLLFRGSPRRWGWIQRCLFTNTVVICECELTGVLGEE